MDAFAALWDLSGAQTISLLALDFRLRCETNHGQTQLWGGRGHCARRFLRTSLTIFLHFGMNQKQNVFSRAAGYSSGCALISSWRRLF
jgi:hypothetical protein